MSYTLLIVDDSTTIRTVLKQTFEMTRLDIDHVFQASNGVEALELIEKEWVDIIFCDINMPEMNGIEFLQKINTHPEYKEIPVVIVSTEGSKTRIKELKKMGVAGYLRKPCRPEELRDMIYECLGSWKNE